MPECDREASIMRGPGSTMAVCALYINSKIFAHSSLLQPQGNGSFYANSLPPIIMRQREEAKGVQACETNIIKELILFMLHYIKFIILCFVFPYFHLLDVTGIQFTPPERSI